MCRVCLLVPPKTCSSRDARKRICKGSSASANCSAKSPVSLQENSESGDEDLERDDRRACFSSDCAPSSAAECESELEAGIDKVRSGMLAGRRRVFGEGIVKGVELICSSSHLRVLEKVGC